MAYVQPNSVIEFYSDIGISQDYNDSLYFENPATKNLYFTNLPKLGRVEKCYYSRDNRGFVRVELPMATMIHAQYMRFQNTSYENKWWYAFVKDVVYINDNTTEVQFELDPLMTWMGDFTLSECFVERQHSETDAIGDNLVEETIDTGEYVYNGQMIKSDGFDHWKYLITIAPDNTRYPPAGTILGLYNGLAYAQVEPEDMTGTISDIMNSGVLPWVQDETRIQNIQLIPSGFLPTNNDPAPREYTMNISKAFDGVGGYGASGDINYVHNNKLYTYPFNVLCVYNSEGDTNTYRFERFTDPAVGSPSATFRIRGSIGVKSEICCYPINYKKLSNNVLGQENFEEQMTMRDFPMCSWTTDTFKAYVAQRLSTLPGTLVQGGATIVAKAALSPSGTQIAQSFMQQHPGASLETANSYAESEIALNMGKAVGIGLGYVAVKEVTAALSAGIAHAITPYQAHGQSSGDLMSILGQKAFYFFRKSVSYEYAKMIDNYFTMFGYADKTVHVPNMNARERFTYVKTIACKINCACPASDANFIEELFNRGIRFWKNHLQIGNYTAPNRPLSEIQGE